MIVVGSVVHMGERVDIAWTGWYPVTGRPRFDTFTKDGDPWGTVTINIPAVDHLLPPEAITIRREMEPYVSAFLATGLFMPTGYAAPSGYTEYPIWLMTPLLLAQLPAKNNPADPAARYAALRALAEDPAASPGEVRNARAAMRRMEKRYGVGVASSHVAAERRPGPPRQEHLHWVHGHVVWPVAHGDYDSPFYERYALVEPLAIEYVIETEWDEWDVGEDRDSRAVLKLYALRPVGAYDAAVWGMEEGDLVRGRVLLQWGANVLVPTYARVGDWRSEYQSPISVAEAKRIAEEDYGRRVVGLRPRTWPWPEDD